MGTKIDQAFVDQIVNGVKSLALEIERLEGLVEAHENQTLEQKIYALAKAIRKELVIATPVTDIDSALDMIHDNVGEALIKE